MKNYKKPLLDQIWDKIIFTPFIGKKERTTLTKSYYNLTSDIYKLDMIQQIRFNYCNHKFLKENIYNDLAKII